MKKSNIVVVCLMVLLIGLAGSALAETKLLPKGVVVSATCDLAAQTAKVSVAGMNGVIEFYSYEKVENLNGNPATVDLNAGRRFNVKDNQGFYALLTPDMAAYPPAFFGPGIGLDCGNPAGCAFLITCK